MPYLAQYTATMACQSCRQHTRLLARSLRATADLYPAALTTLTRATTTTTSPTSTASSPAASTRRRPFSSSAWRRAAKAPTRPSAPASSVGPGTPGTAPDEQTGPVSGALAGALRGKFQPNLGGNPKGLRCKRDKSIDTMRHRGIGVIPISLSANIPNLDRQVTCVSATSPLEGPRSSTFHLTTTATMDPSTDINNNPPQDLPVDLSQNFHAAAMDQVLPEALQEVAPGAMPEILPGMLSTGEMFMPQLAQTQHFDPSQHLFQANGVIPPMPHNAISADEIALYDRQIRLWGMKAQEKIRGANILLITMKALANEVAKNLVLAGIGSLTICDGDVVTEADLGSQFFLAADHSL
ncbi:hypothetical protein BN1723_007413, partial [Verticillium longisporum]